jgi:EmrB/QacA subfamily drug resistance transporter
MALEVTSSVESGGTVIDQFPARSEQGLSGRKLVMLLCCAGAPFLIMLDTNIVAVSLPSIAREFHGEFTDVEWVVSAYILPFAAFLIPAGSLADRLGRRRMLLVGLAIFTIASVLCGFALNLAILNLARALQALGAALQLSGSLGVIAHGFGPRQRAKVFAIWATVMGIAPSLGPVLGGLVTSYFGWRWAFLINLPLGLALISMVFMSAEESRDPAADRLDLPGIVLFGAGLFSIVWALIGANNSGWGSTTTLAKLGTGVVLLAAFVLAETKQSRPMIDLALFRSPSFIGAAVGMLGYAASAQVMMTILPVYLQDAFGFSPATAGLLVIPFALPLLIGPSIGGRLAARLSSRAILTLGLAMAAIGNTVVACAVLAGYGYGAVAVGMFVIGASAGLLNGETAKAQIGAVPPERAGMAGGFSGATRFVGITTGLAGLGAVLAAVSESSLRKLGDATVPGQHIDWRALNLRIVGGDAASALAAIPSSVRVTIGEAVRASIAIGFGVTFIAAACVAALSALLVLILIRYPQAAGPTESSSHS